MDHMKAWPFLLSANLELDYTHVVVPDFIQKSGAIRELSRASADFLHGPDEAVYLKGYHPNVGIIDLIFREVEATERMLGNDSDGVLTDKFRRPIRVFEGFALRDRPSEDQFHFTKEQLDFAHDKVKKRFEQFWRAGKEAGDFSVSECVELPAPKGSILPLKIHESPSLRPPPLNDELNTVVDERVARSVTKSKNLDHTKELLEGTLHQAALPNDVLGSKTEEFVKRQSPHNRKKNSGGLSEIGENLNTVAAFAIITGIVLGAVYLIHRHNIKSKAKKEGFKERIAEERRELEQPHPISFR